MPKPKRINPPNAKRAQPLPAKKKIEMQQSDDSDSEEIYVVDEDEDIDNYYDPEDEECLDDDDDYYDDDEEEQEFEQPKKQMMVSPLDVMRIKQITDRCLPMPFPTHILPEFCKAQKYKQVNEQYLVKL